ncbi:MAG: hypothetical protein E7443_01925 [Ruminococcaceae bacterium]|nr:hypothetical protein [Oscillospiraceae bacterium]
MKRRTFLLLVVLLALLSGCGRGEVVPPSEDTAAAPSQTQQQTAASESGTAQVQAAKKDLTFFVEGEREVLPATRYTGAGYVIYIPDEGWHFEREEDDGMTEERWESIWNDEVELTVYTRPVYPDASAAVTRDIFLAGSDYVFEDVTGGVAGDPLVGREADGDYLCFMTAEGSGGTTYIVAWEYPAEAAEGFGARLRVIADTFTVIEG